MVVVVLVVVVEVMVAGLFVDPSWLASSIAAKLPFIFWVVLLEDCVVLTTAGPAVEGELSLVALFVVGIAAVVTSFSRADNVIVAVDFVVVVASVDGVDGDADEEMFNEVLFVSRSTDLGSTVVVLAMF